MGKKPKRLLPDISVAAKKEEGTAIINIGCRYQDPRTGCRCGEEVNDRDPLCIKHKNSALQQVSTFGPSSIAPREGF